MCRLCTGHVYFMFCSKSSTNLHRRLNTATLNTMSSKATEIAKNLPTLEHPDGSPIRALVVDDEEMLKELVSMGLKMIGWEVQSAGDGPTALAIAPRLAPRCAGA